MLLALEIQLLEIVYEGGNPIGLRCDGVDNVRLQLLGVCPFLADQQVLKKIEHGHGEEIGKFRELLGRDQSLTSFVFFIRLKRDTEMRGCSRCAYPKLLTSEAKTVSQMQPKPITASAGCLLEGRTLYHKTTCSNGGVKTAVPVWRYDIWQWRSAPQCRDVFDGRE